MTLTQETQKTKKQKNPRCVKVRVPGRIIVTTIAENEHFKHLKHMCV